MPGGLGPADRKLLAGAGVVTLLLVAGSIAFAPGAEQEDSPVPSTYSSTSGGARAAYLLLYELGYDVQRWEDSPTNLAEASHDALLILAEPTDRPTKPEAEALVRFVRDGGRVLFCGPALQSYFAGPNVSGADAGLEWKEFTPSLPSYISRDAGKVLMQPRGHWRELGSTPLRLYGAEDSPSVVEWRIGKGTLLWWAGATPLTNAGISRADNLKLFLNSVAGPPPGEKVAIYWDEYFHGQRSSLWSYVERTPLGWGMLQFALLTIGILFTFSRRSGPIVPAPVVSRLSPLEFVDTMGGLYERAGAGSIAVAVSYRHFRFELARTLGMPMSAAHADLARAAGARLGVESRGLTETLQSGAQASNDGKLTPRQALSLVKALEDYSTQLREPRRSAQLRSGENN